jgi:hypothetical protein
MLETTFAMVTASLHDDPDSTTVISLRTVERRKIDAGTLFRLSRRGDVLGRFLSRKSGSNTTQKLCSLSEE